MTSDFIKKHERAGARAHAHVLPCILPYIVPASCRVTAGPSVCDAEYSFTIALQCPLLSPLLPGIRSRPACPSSMVIAWLEAVCPRDGAKFTS